MQVDQKYDVIIIGAGAAGLMAARELLNAGKSVLIIEAKDRCGGRIHTITDSGFPLPVELGAEFVHGNLPITKQLMIEADLKWQKVEGSYWQNSMGKWFQNESRIPDEEKVLQALQDIKEDIPVSHFLNSYFADEPTVKEGVRNYIEGYYAGDIKKVSTLALREELEESDEEEYRIEGGYKNIIDFLAKSIEKKGSSIEFKTPVTAIEWQTSSVIVKADTRIFLARKVLITVPLGVLLAHTISFTPNLPQLQTSLDQLGYGAAIKIVLSFENSFWQQDSKRKDLSMLFSEEIIPTWWTQYPKEVPVLTGWVAGGQAKNLVFFKKEVLLEKALQSIANIFQLSLKDIKEQLKGWHVNNWNKGPYARGAYSYDTVNSGEIKEVMKAGIDNTIYFGGEGWFHGLELGTVEAALHSGRDTAKQMIAHF